MIDPTAGLSFEEAIARLEAVVEQLESGELPLEESLRRFEEGIALQRRCIADLNHAQRRIEVLSEEAAAAPLFARGQLAGEGAAAPGEW
jgi:exodeoxyribonuclease VII small subunit